MRKIFIILAVAALFLAACQAQPAPLPSAEPGASPLSSGTPPLAPVPVISGDGVKVPPDLYPVDPYRVPSPAASPAAASAPPASAAVSSYQPFTLAAYNRAKADGRPVMLYFYATWCPLCAGQEPTVVSLFANSEIAAWGIAAFRVNYNDDQTDDDERALARELGVNYQHTFFTFDSSGRQVWRATGTQSREQLQARLAEIR